MDFEQPVDKNQLASYNQISVLGTLFLVSKIENIKYRFTEGMRMVEFHSWFEMKLKNLI